MGTKLDEAHRCLAIHKRPTGVSIDSRTIGEGELFFAVKGDRFDGHDFVGEALDRGAVGAVVSRSRFGRDFHLFQGEKPAIPVQDTIFALQELAKHYRSKFDLPVVAVTGTNGKTTTKDMIAAVLSRKYKVLKTEGNFNNHIGLPLTVLNLEAKHQVAAIEMGMSGFGEIRRLSKVSDPTMGVLTNVGPAHLEFFGSVERIAAAKAELLEYLTEPRVAVLNADDDLVMRHKEKVGGKIVTFGMEKEADVRGIYMGNYAKLGSRFRVNGGLEICLRLLGKHNVYNSLAAVAVGREFGVREQDIKAALEQIQASPMRMEWVEMAGVGVINDAYNANPISVKMALETLTETKGDGKRIAILGDMLELGEAGLQAHRRIGKVVATLGIDYLLSFSQLSKFMADGAIESGMARDRVDHFVDKGELIERIGELVAPGDIILVKGSRKMRLEEVVEGLKERLSPSL